MSGRIPQAFIDQLLDRTDIVDVVSAAVRLKKTGRNYSACCPFHQEKSPSFTVSPEKQFYYCFGCGASGNALGFLMEHERLPFTEAVERLAHRAGLDVPRERSSPEAEQAQRQRLNLYDRLQAVSDWYCEQLGQSPEAIDYLKRRGVSANTARDYGIGFAPAGWDKQLQHFGSDETAIAQLVDAGLVVTGDDGRQRDRFRERIMFPIRDDRGRVLGFGGRVLGTGKPKYLNSPETLLFQKGRELYGLYEARRSGSRLDRLIVVEGYLDVILLAQHGIHQAVATLGTALTFAHLERLFRQVSEVVFCFDGDSAGLKAAHRALETSLPALHDGRLLRFMFLPDGEDPDSLVQKEGPTRFLDRVAGAESLSAFLFRHAAEGLDATSADGRARFAQQALGLIGRTPEGMFRSLLLNELAQRTGLDANRLEQNLAGHAAATPAASPSVSPQRKNTPAPPPHDPSLYHTSPGLAHKGIVLLLHAPHLAAELPALEPDTLNHLPLPELPLLARLLDTLRAQPDTRIPGLLARWQAEGLEGSEQLAQLAVQEPDIQGDEAIRLELQGLLTSLQTQARRNRSRRLEQHLATDPGRGFSSLSPEEQADFRDVFQRRNGEPPPV